DGHGTGRLLERRERGARVVVQRDLAGGITLLGHGLGAPLIESDAVTIAAPREPRIGPVHRDREKGALERVVADEAPEIVAAEGGRPAGAVDGDARDAQRRA